MVSRQQFLMNWWSQVRGCFFIEAMLPAISDEVLLGYTSQQLDWARQHEGDIWAFLVGEQLLYSNNFDAFKSF